MAEQNVQNPSVDEPPPRVDVSTGLIVSYPTEAVVKSSKEAWPTQDHRNYITQDEEEAPAHNTRTRKGTRSITKELILAAVEMSTVQPMPRNLASIKFPMRLLCDMAGAIMDVNVDLLEYRHLMKL